MSSSSPTSGFSIKELPRARWNVLDMITFVGVKSIRNCIITDIDMTWAEEKRKQLNESGKKITITAFLLKAIGIAQRTHRASRTMCLPFGRRAIFKDIAAGFTVEKMVNDQPVVFFGTIDRPDAKTLEAISDELSQYAQRPIEALPRLAKEERFTHLFWLLRRLVLWSGLQHPYVRLLVNQSTFGLTSLGKMGVQAVVSPCSGTSTFGVGNVELRPVVRDGAVVVRPILTLSYTFDQRVLDGRPAGRFLKEIRDLLEGRLEEHLTVVPTS
jgi:hypothetical protein